MKLPKAKHENTVVQHLKDETLVYDLKTDQAFCLNETSAKVFNHCDGKTTFAELKDKYKFTDDLIYLALDELKAKNLLAENYQNNHFTGMTRRETIKKVGLATMIALPLVASMTAPKAAHAASNAPVNQCRALTCADRVGSPLGGGCNPPNGCAAIGLECCASVQGNSCTCFLPGLCVPSGGQVCT
jgi:hypothetical protein